MARAKPGSDTKNGMSFRLEMLQVARLAPKLLGESTALVEGFYRSRIAPTGGFLDRDEKPDLYYTVFGLEGLQALSIDASHSPDVRPWLRTFDSGDGLDFVHLCCLARCWADAGIDGLPPQSQEALAARIEAYRCPDGGYHQASNRSKGSAYGCLLAWGAYQDLGGIPPEPWRLVECMGGLRTRDGAWSNEPGIPVGSTTATAAMVALHRHMEITPPAKAVEWLMRQCLPQGGFLALPAAPLPDLLSTAVALHALDAVQVDFSRLKEPCLDFVDSLWNATGGFHGNWTDNTLDCEYTYYGLLALGHLSL
ncbi:MAG: prenyltransferase/squalene oxidase repeat-containing protein [Prosthecobacter sp.]